MVVSKRYIYILEPVSIIARGKSVNITLVVKDVIELLILRGGAYAESSGWALNAILCILRKESEGFWHREGGGERCDHRKQNRVMRPKTNTNDEFSPEPAGGKALLPPVF